MWVCRAADCGSKVCSFRQLAAGNGAALPTANAGQHARNLHHDFCQTIVINID